MKIISTHVNADFDGFAAMVGLLKLHPDAHLVFPGAKEPTLRHFFNENRDDFPELSIRDISNVSHLILVDVGREDRLGPLGAHPPSSEAAVCGNLRSSSAGTNHYRSGSASRSSFRFYNHDCSS